MSVILVSTNVELTLANSYISMNFLIYYNNFKLYLIIFQQVSCVEEDSIVVLRTHYGICDERFTITQNLFDFMLN